MHRRADEIFEHFRGHVKIGDHAVLQRSDRGNRAGGAGRSFPWPRVPTAMTIFSLTSIATTDGSRMTMPLPFIYTRVFAVPRSIPISRLNNIHLFLSFWPAGLSRIFITQPLPGGRGGAPPSIDAAAFGVPYKKGTNFDNSLDCRYYIIYAARKILNRKKALFSKFPFKRKKFREIL